VPTVNDSAGSKNIGVPQKLHSLLSPTKTASPKEKPRATPCSSKALTRELPRLRSFSSFCNLGAVCQGGLAGSVTEITFGGARSSQLLRRWLSESRNSLNWNGYPLLRSCAGWTR
jgi:hypothetical protein